MDAAELARWTRFAAKGGIGKCTAIQDCVAERPEDLMFLKGDEITVLMQLPDRDGVYLGYCEGVVGHFQGTDVHFHTKLKKPIMTRRVSANAASFTASKSKSPSPIISSLVRRDSEASVVLSPVSSPAPSVPSNISIPPVIVSPSPMPSPSQSPSTDPGASLASSAVQARTPSEPTASGGISPQFQVPESTSKVEDESHPIVRESQLEPLVSDKLGNTVAHVALASHENVHASFPPILAQSIADSTYDSDAGTRISMALSDGGVGIGLSLLQDMANDEDDDSWSSGDSGPHRVYTPEQRDSSSPTQLNSDVMTTPVAQPSTATRSRSSSHLSSPTSIQRSQSDYGEWEGASDIYDDYRYSRYSMASKMSRLSQGSSNTVPIAAELPPLPRPSMDRGFSTDSQPHRAHPSNPPSPLANEFSKMPAHISLLDPLATRNSARPPSLDLSSSPLLHTSFSSPYPSPDLVSSFASPAPTTATLTPVQISAGAASALRMKLENERSPTSVAEGANQSDLEDGSTPSKSFANADDEALPLSESPELLTTIISPSPTSQPLSYANPPESAPPEPAVRERDVESSVAVARPRPPRSATLPPPNGAASRESLFLPHPNAPKPPPSSTGPMYARLAPQRSSPQAEPPIGSIIHTLHLASKMRHGPNGVVRRTTVYGRLDFDLASSMGPVPISFTTEPPSPSNTMERMPLSRRGNVMSPVSPSPSPSQRTFGEQVVPSTELTVGEEQRTESRNAIPRQNFLPKVNTPRPRSRSFSGFQTEFTEVPPPMERSFQEGVLPLNIRSRSQSTKGPPTALSLSTPKTTVAPQTPLRSPITSSPLSLPQNNSVAPLQPLRCPSSPLSFITAPLSPASRKPVPHLGLRNAASLTALNSSEVNLPPAPTRPSLSKAPTDDESGASSPISVSPLSPLQDSGTSVSSHAKGRTSDSSSQPWLTMPRGSVDGNLEGRHQMTSPPPIGMLPSTTSSSLVRNVSLRSKLSLSALRGKNTKSSTQDESSSIAASDSSPETETVQVKDMDFELVKPAIPQLAPGRSSEDSTLMSHDAPNAKGDMLGLPRSESPTSSMSAATRPPTAVSDASFNASRKSSDPQSSSTSSMDAHRQRELKWVALMSSTPASQARKSKKVRKLLLEGVPSSVRYLVWAHLTDSKAKGMAGLYSQLGRRGKVSSSDDIERDVRKLFTEQPHMQNSHGSLVALLQAYLIMVPDIQYDKGLTFIGGHLLLLAPEEDAFWIFVSLMDAHLRQYFSTNTIQTEVDGLLFSKALEVNDGPVAKKIFVDMGMSPARICRLWFTSLFVETLPIEYLHRVWDVFLYEGVVFLFRVGLALLSCCRRQVLESTSEQGVLLHLLHPPHNSLPSTSDAFIALVFTIKIKDDDVRKSRVKLEAQVKRQTQVQRPQGGSISLPRN